MTAMKLPKRVRMAAVAAALLTFPTAIVLSLLLEFNTGEWLAMLGWAGILTLALVQFGLGWTLGDREVG